MRQMSREHRAVFDYKTASLQYRDIAANEDNTFENILISIDDPISNFILCELNIRQGERCQAAGVQPELASYSLSIGNRYNLQGIAGLATAKQIFTSYRQSLGVLPPTGAEFQVELDTFKTEMLNYLIGVEVKASDIAQLKDKLNEVLATIPAGANGNALLDYIYGSITELEDVRQQPGRGSEDNIAWWKLLAAAAWIGFAVWTLYSCYYRSCTAKQRKTYETVMKIASMVYGACE